MNAAYGNNSDFVWRHHSAGVDLRRRYSFEHYGMGSRRGAAVGPRHGQVGAGHLSGCDVTPNINRSRLRNWHLACPTGHGAPSRGAKAVPKPYPRGLLECEFMPHGAILRGASARAGRNNGC
jgi:hypothetical protein